MMWLADFHFMRPLWLLMLLLPLFIGAGIWKSEQVQSSWAKVCDEHLLKFLLIKGQNKQRKRSYFLFLLICIITILALAGPTWLKKENPALKVNNPVILALNVSDNMWSKDVSPNRGERAKYITHDLLEMLQTSEVGLMVYSSEPYVVTPLTEDASMVDNLLDIISPNIMPENGDRLDRAINLAVTRMQEMGYGSGNIVVLTADVGERFDAALETAADAANSGFDVNIIKMSDTENDKLSMVAQKGNGLLLGYRENLQSLMQKINNHYQKEVQQSENMQATWLDMGYYLFWLPALLLLYYFRRGVILLWLIFIWSNSAQAGWFLNDNQEAMRAFKAEDYQTAAKKFKDVSWRGAAAYKSGNYEQALRDFNTVEGLDALYNQGNALAKSGKIEAAIKKYEEVLAQDENFADARFNLEYLKQQQQNQQQQSQQNQSNDKQQKSEQQQNQQQNQTENKQQAAEKADNQQEQSKDNEQKDNTSQPKAKNNADNNSKADNQDSSKDEQNANDEDENKQQNTQAESSEANEKKDGQKNLQNAEVGNEEGEQKAQAMQAEGNDEKSAEEKEKIRARQQRFREIPEDKGGLLRAFIRREYERQRYKD